MAQASTGQIVSASVTGGNAIGGFINSESSAAAIRTSSDFDTKLAALRAQDAIVRGNAAARTAELETSGTVGRARAALAAGGVEVSSGSAAATQVQDATIGELDAQMIRNNAAREALGYTTDAAFAAIGARQRASAIEAQGVETLATGAARTYGMLPASKRVPGSKGAGPSIGIAGSGNAPLGDFGSDIDDGQ